MNYFATYEANASDYCDGLRFIPVRRTEGELWLDTEYVLDNIDDARDAVEWMDCLDRLNGDAAAEYPIVGVVEVDLRIVALHPKETVATRAG